METVETQESPPPPLDSSLAPVLVFNCGRGGADPEEGDGDARLVYSIPKKQLLLARESGCFIDNVNWVTAQGWVLTLEPGTRGTSLRDPFTSRTVSLPPDSDGLLAGSDETTCVMSTCRPTDPGCVVLVAHLTDPVLCYCRPGGSRWFRYEYQPDLLDTDGGFIGRDYIIDQVAKPTAALGRFYTYWPVKLATLEFSPDPTLSTTHVEHRPLPPGCHCYEYCLVESCGELFKVMFCGTTSLGKRESLVIEVERLEWSRSAWVRVTALGSNRVFFVGRDQFGASLPADEFGFKENCVYFWNNDDKGMYVHDMDQGTTALHNPGIEIPDSLEPILLMPAT